MRELIVKLYNEGIKRISFIGGEPFMKDYIFESALFASRLGIKTSAVSNGTLFCGDIAELCVRWDAFDDIIFSVDGYKENHDLIRGSGVYETVEKNIRSLTELKKKYKKKTPSVMIYMTISKYNSKSFDKDVKSLMRLNPSSLRLQLASSVSNDIVEKTNQMLGGIFMTTHSYSLDVSVDYDEIVVIKDKIKKLKEIYGGKIKAEKILEGSNNSCKFLFKSAVITPSGKILPCPMLVNFDIGNIKHISLKDAFAKNEDILKRIMDFSSKSLPICGQCCVEKVII